MSTSLDDALLLVDDPRSGRLVLAEGEHVVLLGASGSGKTSWLRSLLGLDEAFRGVWLRGRRARPSDIRDEVGFVPQADGVFLSLSVWDNVARIPHLPAVPDDRARDALDLVGLVARAHEPVSCLSTNERRRVALARALALRRRLVVIDGEPDATIWPLLRPLLAQAPWVRGVLVASAVADEQAWRAHRVALLEAGRVVAEGALASLWGREDAAVRRVLAWVSPEPR